MWESSKRPDRKKPSRPFLSSNRSHLLPEVGLPKIQNFPTPQVSLITGKQVQEAYWETGNEFNTDSSNRAQYI